MSRTVNFSSLIWYWVWLGSNLGPNGKVDVLCVLTSELTRKIYLKVPEIFKLFKLLRIIIIAWIMNSYIADEKTNFD